MMVSDERESSRDSGRTEVNHDAEQPVTHTETGLKHVPNKNFVVTEKSRYCSLI
jgi:hypothetical protein